MLTATTQQAVPATTLKQSVLVIYLAIRVIEQNYFVIRVIELWQRNGFARRGRKETRSAPNTTTRSKR